MKKILLLAICIISTFALSVFAPFGNNFGIKTANADIVTSAKLEYFELDKPLFALRHQNKVYIAEKERIVIYYNDVYHAIVLSEKLPDVSFDVKNIAICANNLLILSNNTLFALDISTFTLNKLVFEGQSENPITFDNVASFSAFENYFAINDFNCKTYLFEISEQGLALKSTYDDTHNPSQLLSLTSDLFVYYLSADKSVLRYINSPNGQEFYNKFELSGVNCLDFEQVLYLKCDNAIYSVGKNSAQDVPKLVADLGALSITNSGGFSVYGDKILVCDTQNDRVVEFDITNQKLTDFEISFTKIYVPEDFKIEQNFSPLSITVEKGELLYDINLEQSEQKGYFVFNGYHTQNTTANYLVVATFSDLYYLVAGDVLALVLKENFVASPIAQTQINKTVYLTSNATTYLQPLLINQCAWFNVEKFEPVTLLYTVEVSSITFGVINHNGTLGYLPLSFFVYDLEKLPEYSNFETASTHNKMAVLYEDKDCTIPLYQLTPNTQVIITEKSGDTYKVLVGDKVGYISKNEIAKRGDTTKKVVSVILLLSLGLFFTALYLEIKYLYTKSKPFNK